MSDAEVEVFWQNAKAQLHLNAAPGYFGPTPLESVTPPAWAFGATPEQADELLALVLGGRKTATAGALWDYEHEGEPIASPGDLSILLDGAGHPHALVETLTSRVVPFDQVDAEHARLEGEGDLSLEHWRRVHRDFFTAVATHGRGFRDDMPIVLETFRVRYQISPGRD